MFQTNYILSSLLCISTIGTLAFAISLETTITTLKDLKAGDAENSTVEKLKPSKFTVIVTLAVGAVNLVPCGALFSFFNESNYIYLLKNPENLHLLTLRSYNRIKPGRQILLLYTDDTKTILIATVGVFRCRGNLFSFAIFVQLCEKLANECHKT